MKEKQSDLLWQQVVQKNKTLRNRKTPMGQAATSTEYQRSKTPTKNVHGGSKAENRITLQSSMGFRNYQVGGGLDSNTDSQGGGTQQAPELMFSKFSRTTSYTGSVTTKTCPTQYQSVAVKSANILKENGNISKKKLQQNKREFKILFPTTRECHSSNSPSKENESVETEIIQGLTPCSTHFSSARIMHADPPKIVKLKREVKRPGSRSPQQSPTQKNGI
jgi:hypothetical protein